MLADSAIKKLLDEGVLEDADSNRIGPVSYDLKTMSFYSEEDGGHSTCVLAPGNSVFVGAKEIINLPDNLTARVALKNSRIRQGLSLEAPVYFPGHHTRVFFRVTNISAAEISLDSSKDIAQIFFEKVDAQVSHPYEGVFVDEFDYRGLGDYTNIYDSEIRKLESKSEQIEGIERRLYGNVVELMGIFVAIFALVDVNVAWASNEMPIFAAIVLNLSAVGGLAAMSGLIALITQPNQKKARIIAWTLSAISFVAALGIFLICR